MTQFMNLDLTGEMSAQAEVRPRAEPPNSADSGHFFEDFRAARLP
jgi:hypothetical protein